MNFYMELNCPECGAPLEVYYDGSECMHPNPWLIRHCNKCHSDWESKWLENGTESKLERKFWG